MGRACGGRRHDQLSRKWELLSFLASALRRLLPPHVTRLSSTNASPFLTIEKVFLESSEVSIASRV